MHLPDGILSGPLLAAGMAGAAIGVGIGLRRMREEEIPQAALLGATFFVASLIHVPLGLASFHLVLNGLLGILLGWAAFPVVLIGLLLQCVFFGHGGLTTLGVNTLNMALPAVACWYLFGRSSPSLTPAMRGFVAGLLGIVGASLLTSLWLVGSSRAFLPTAQLLVLVQWPLMLIEGAIAGAALSLIVRLRPTALPLPLSPVPEG